MSAARHDGQEHSAESRRDTMPRQKRSRHLPLSGRNGPDEQERSQGIVEQARAIHKSLEEQQASEDDRMLRVFMLVYWLAREGLPMLKIYTLAMLIRALDFRGAINCVWDVGRKYVNHMAATEIMMAMAAVLREWINSHACCSVRKVNRGAATVRI